jgi:hypothetical protein
LPFHFFVAAESSDAQNLGQSPIFARSFHFSPLILSPLLMFQRQSREPFPARNILLLAVIILLGLLYLIRQMQEKPAEPPPLEAPALQQDTTLH